MIVLQGAKERVEALLFSADGRSLVAPFSGGGQLWSDVSAGKSPPTVLGHPSVSPVCFTPDGRGLLLAGSQVAVHDLPRVQVTTLLEFPNPYQTHISYCSLTPDGRSLIAAEIEYNRRPPTRLLCWPLADPKAPTWSVSTARLIHAPPLFLPGGERFILFEWRWEPPPVGVGREYVTRDTWTGQVLSEVTAPQGHDFCNPVLSGDRRLIAARRSTRMTILRADDLGAEPVMLRNDNRKEFTGLAFHPSGRYLAATSNDATVKLYDTATWTTAQSFDWAIGRLRSVAFSPDGMLAAAGGDKGQVIVWDTDL